MSLYLLKIPVPSFLEQDHLKAQGRLTALTANKSLLSSFSPSPCLHLISFFFLPLSLSSLVSMSAVCLPVSPFSHAAHSEPEPRPLIEILLLLWRDGVGEGEKVGASKDWTNVQLHLNQSSEPDSSSAPGYFLNTKAKETQKEKREIQRETEFCQTAITDGTVIVCLCLEQEFEYFKSLF